MRHCSGINIFCMVSRQHRHIGIEKAVGHGTDDAGEVVRT